MGCRLTLGHESVVRPEPSITLIPAIPRSLAFSTPARTTVHQIWVSNPPADPRAGSEWPQDEEIRRAAEKRQREEEAEAGRWMKLIDVEESGHELEDESGAPGRMQQLVAFIKERKMVPLEAVAAEFKMGSQDAINRIQVRRHSA